MKVKLEIYRDFMKNTPLCVLREKYGKPIKRIIEIVCEVSKEYPLRYERNKNKTLERKIKW